MTFESMMQLKDDADITVVTIPFTKVTISNGGTCYTNSVVRGCLALSIECSVPLRKIHKAIFTVLRSSRQPWQQLQLPSIGFLSGLLSRSNIFSKLQLHDVFKGDESSIVLHSDGTMRYFKHFVGFQMSLMVSIPIFFVQGPFFANKIF